MNHAQLLEHFDCISEAPDAISRLRRFILDLAVRGKLVEQDPTDEPAVELLKRITEAKKQLIASKKLQKIKAFEPLGEDDITYDIPVNWVATRLGMIYDVRDGTHDTPKYVETGYPLITGRPTRCATRLGGRG